MSRKQLFRQSNNQSIADIFERFIASQTAKGVSDKTIQNYHSHFHSLGKHLDFSVPLATLTKDEIDNMVISMRRSGLAHNSISSYLRVFHTFLKKPAYDYIPKCSTILPESGRLSETWRGQPQPRSIIKWSFASSSCKSFSSI